MKKSQLIFTQYSPLLAVDVDITGIDGEKIAVPRVYSLCRCSKSAWHFALPCIATSNA